MDISGSPSSDDRWQPKWLQPFVIYNKATPVPTAKNKHKPLFLKDYKNHFGWLFKSGNRQAAKLFRSWIRVTRGR